MMIPDSMLTADVYELGQLLVERGCFDHETWRKFHCKCARSVWRFLTEEARHAIEVAEAYTHGNASQREVATQHERMRTASDIAWRKVDALKEKTDQLDAVWPLSDEVDEAWSRYLSAEVARVATQDVIEAYSIPEAASSLRAWAIARKEVASGSKQPESASRQSVEKQWKEIRDSEEAKQASTLRDLFSCTPREQTLDQENSPPRE